MVVKNTTKAWSPNGGGLPTLLVINDANLHSARVQEEIMNTTNPSSCFLRTEVEWPPSSLGRHMFPSYF
jgi:hypothetical protein